MKKPTHFFLGANSMEGFYSLYEQLLDAELYDLIIIKGGPGNGKSSFMRHIANGIEQCHREVVYIHCSGDPASLDAVLFPDIRTAIVDGTAPHVLEPRYTGAAERYVDLSSFFRTEEVKAIRSELIACSDEYRAAYQSAYHCLHAAGWMETEYRKAMHNAIEPSKLNRRFNGILAREFGGKKTEVPGRTVNAFLGGMTHQGRICRFDTVDALCPRVYECMDNAGLGTETMQFAGDTARSYGADVILCRNPDHPKEIEHLLIPSKGLAFVTSRSGLEYPGESYRRIRINAMAEDTMTRTERARLRFLRRIYHSLEEEALTALQNAKRAHDALETLYNPHVDFDGVLALAEEELARILTYPVH